MPRQSWPKSEARKIQQRLWKLIHDQFESQADFIRACGLTRDTSSKWFGAAPRVPDTRSLALIAAQCDVSLDWLIRGKGEPAPNLRAAQVALFDAVEARMRRRRDRRMLRAVRTGLGHGPKALWGIVVAEAEDLPSLERVASDLDHGDD